MVWGPSPLQLCKHEPQRLHLTEDKTWGQAWVHVLVVWCICSFNHFILIKMCPLMQVTSQQPVRSLGSFTPISRKPPAAVNCSTEKDPSSRKRRRALDYLSRIPSPPPLATLGSAASPCVNKTFNPPRRSATPSTLKPVQTRKPVSSPVEDEWVNDEELAMIDTQALRVGELL